MKRIFAAALGLLAFAGVTATAADLPRYQPVAPVYNPVYYWTGFYIGINGGGGWGESQWDGINKFDLSGGLIGGSGGHPGKRQQAQRRGKDTLHYPILHFVRCREQYSQFSNSLVQERHTQY